jgi:dTDP-4-dehydrorhamnose 3,5-epimerase
MTFTETPLSGAYLVTPSPRSDQRGWFMRTYDKQLFTQIGHTADWVQMNHSFTRQVGAVRGMHFQHPPAAEIKLVRCVAGSVFDVIVDLRQGSPTLGQWFGAELSADNKQMLYIPQGFAHGFQTLTTDCQLIYCHSAYYTPDAEGAIRYNDPHIGITWPLPVTDLSERDATHPYLAVDFAGLTL